MYLAQNVIRSAIRESEDPLNILVINDLSYDYLERLALCFPQHKFFMVQSICKDNNQWDRPIACENLKYYVDFHELDDTYFDVIICFNRLEAFSIANNISNMYHIPLINIDFASAHTRYPVPFGANLTTQDSYINNRGIVSVGSTDFITGSWKVHNSKIGATIGLPYKIFNKNPNAYKILVDKTLPQEFYDGLPINFDENLFTSDINEAAIYCHFLPNPTCLLLDCIASEIPIVSFNSVDLNEYLQEKFLIIIDNVSKLSHPNFAIEVKKFMESNNTLQNAKKYVEEHNKEINFKNKWNNILTYCSNTFYQRGI